MFICIIGLKAVSHIHYVHFVHIARMKTGHTWKKVIDVVVLTWNSHRCIMNVPRQKYE